MPRKPQSNTRRDLVSNEILEKASALFADRGFANTTLQDVAQALEISRTALYHYVGSKDELLRTLVRGVTRETADGLERIAFDDTLDPVGKLEAALRDMSTRIANNPARFRLLLMSEGTLPEPLASEHQAARRAVLAHLTAIVREGVEGGRLRILDEQLTAFALLGMCNWVAWWYRPDREGGPTVEDVANHLAVLGVESVRAADERSSPGSSGVEHALTLLRQDLAYLERSIAEPSGRPRDAAASASSPARGRRGRAAPRGA
jgi:AcrR family transcriptional regulator